MDPKYINEIVDFLDKMQIQVIEPELRGAKYNDDETREVRIDLGEVCYGRTVQVSNNWIIENMLVFSLYDGYLEEKYALPEGQAFRQRYLSLPENTDQERLEKNCYRLIKLMRNAILHNLSKIVVSDKGYNINYSNQKNQAIQLEISQKAVRFLYTILLTLVQNKKLIKTKGHWENLLYSYYHEMQKGIVSLQDDIASAGLIPLQDQHIYLNFASRYQVQNPIVTEDTPEGLVIKRFGKRPTEMSDYYLMRDGEAYIIPEEITEVTEDKEQLRIPVELFGELWRGRIE